jgi:VIT1/CCC1 family predicted Fe2+/Mn2+ transporter
MKRGLVFIIGALLCLPTAFGAPVNGPTIVGVALIATAVTAQFIIENERTKS